MRRGIWRVGDGHVMVLPVFRSPLSRRGFVAGASAVTLAASARIVRAQGRRILIIGDSMIAGGFGLYLARDLQREDGYPTIRDGKASTGLARPDFFDWPARARELVAEHGVCDATVVMLGGNDAQGLYLGKGAWIRFPEQPQWQKEYARRVVELCDIVAPGHEQIFWVGMPVMKPEKLHAKVQRINWICRAEMAIRPHALFVDIWRLLADEDGNYTDRVVIDGDGDGDADDGAGSKRRRGTRVRAGDGIHLSPAGSQYLADYVRATVVDTLGRSTPP